MLAKVGYNHPRFSAACAIGLDDSHDRRDLGEISKYKVCFKVPRHYQGVDDQDGS